MEAPARDLTSKLHPKSAQRGPRSSSRSDRKNKASTATVQMNNVQKMKVATHILLPLLQHVLLKRPSSFSSSSADDKHSRQTRQGYTCADDIISLSLSTTPKIQPGRAASLSIRECPHRWMYSAV